MIRRYCHILIPLVAVAVTTVGCSRSDASRSTLDGTPPVAIVAERAISAEEYRRTYVDYLLDTGLPDDPARREAFLRRLVNVSLIAEKERAAGIEQTAAFSEQARLVSTKLLVDSFVEYEIYSSIEVTEADLKDMFVRANTEMTVRHLYARTLDEAERLERRLRSGESFEMLAGEVFDDPQLSSSGGLVGPFAFGEMDPSFEEAAFSLPEGQISEPIRTANGYSVLRVEERTVKPLLTENEFAERRDRLKAQVAFRKKARARAAFLADMMMSLDPVFDAGTLEALATQVLTGRPAEDEALADEAVLARLGGGDEAWTVGDFRRAAELASEDQIARIQTVRDLTTFVEGLIAREQMAGGARAAGLDETPRYRTAFRSEMDRWVYDRAYTALVEQIHVPADSIHGYWQEFGDELVTDAMVDVREIVVSNAAARTRVAAELETGRFEDVARRHSIRTNSSGHRGDVVRMTREQLGLFADRVFDADAGDVIGPQEVSGATVWIQVVDHVPARPMTLEEAGPQIERMIRWSQRQTVLSRAADEVRTTVSVNTWPERVLSMELTAATPASGSVSTARPTAGETSPVSPKRRDIGS